MSPGESGSLTQLTEQFFHAALELPEGERQGYLDGACNGNRELLLAVCNLLRADSGQMDYWEDPALVHEARMVALQQDSAGEDPSGFDRYRLLERIGSGGMGAVYRAVRDDDAFSKVVALKIVERGHVDPITGEVLFRRFRQERQILARLEHPHIARLLDGGSTRDGRPFLVMEYVDGEPINHYVTTRNLPASAILDLFLKICSAVSCAHRNLVVHRDLKPANILVSSDGEPHLLDFGIASLIGNEVSAAHTLHSGMTPRYASPEQVGGAPITTASDIYSLGVLLYELLTGSSPYRDPDNPAELVLAILGESPLPLKSTGRAFSRDLENIVLMALRKEPARRYVSAEQFADDIRRCRENYPVIARPDTPAYRVRKFVVRNRLAVCAAAALSFTLGLSVLSVVAQRNRAERNEAGYRRLAYERSMSMAFLEWQAANSRSTLELLEAQRPRPGESDLRGFEWYALWNLTRTRSRIVWQLPGPANGVAISPDGLTAAATFAPGRMQLWNTATGASRVLDGPGVAAFSPDGRFLGCGAGDGSVDLRAPTSGALLHILGKQSGSIRALSFSPDGRVLATASHGGTVGLWMLNRPGLPVTLKGHTGSVNAVVFSPDGRVVASGSDDMTVRIWDASSGSPIAILRGHSWLVLSLAFSPDGSVLASSGSDGNIRLWNRSSWQEAGVISGNGSSVQSLRYSPDGRLVAVASNNGVIRLYDARSHTLYDTLPGHDDTLTELAFSPDGRYLLSSSRDRTVRLWELARQAGTLTLNGHSDWIWDVQFSPDGHTLASAGKDGAVRLWAMPSGKPMLLLAHSKWVNGIAFSPDGRSLATVSDDRMVRLWNTSSGELTATLAGHTDISECAAFSPDGALLATGGKNGEIRLWRFPSGAPRSLLRSPDNNLIWAMVFSRDGRYLIAAEGGARDLGLAHGQALTIWDVASGHLLTTLRDHTEDVRALALSADGRTLATGSFDGTVQLYSLTSGQTLRLQGMATLTTHQVRSLAFSPDCKRLATAGQDKSVRLWDVETRHEVSSLTLPSEPDGVTFSPDGQNLAVGAHDGKLRLWFATSKQYAK